MIELFNIASLILGLVAMTLPVINIMLSRKNKNRNWGALSVLSLSFCSLSIWLLTIFINDNVSHEDWSALMDTTPSILKITGVLLFVTILLNAVTYFMNRKQGNK